MAVMDPQEKALFEKMGGLSQEEHLPQDWARLAWPTAFTCRRTGKPKAESAIRNAEAKAVRILTEFTRLGLVTKRWDWNDEKKGFRVVYRRSV